MYSAILPLLIGGIFLKKLSVFLKLIWASILVSLLFDALSSFCFNTKSFLCDAIGYYSVAAIFVWGLAFRYLVQENLRRTDIYDILYVLILVIAVSFSISNNGILSTNYSSATTEALYILGCSTFLIMYFLIIKKEIERNDIPIIMVLSAYIIYFATTISIFIFFVGLTPNELINLYLVKWIFYILLNLGFSYVFYSVGRGKWKSE